jgi:hypothetical protein
LQTGSGFFVFSLLFKNESEIQVRFSKRWAGVGHRGESRCGVIQTTLLHCFGGLLESFDRSELVAHSLTSGQHEGKEEKVEGRLHTDNAAAATILGLAVLTGFLRRSHIYSLLLDSIPTNSRQLQDVKSQSLFRIAK